LPICTRFGGCHLFFPGVAGFAGRIDGLVGLAAGVVADGGDEDRITAIGNLRRTRETTITLALSRRGDGSNGAASIESIVAYQARETPRLSRIL
jgi:hypothetical protein